MQVYAFHVDCVPDGASTLSVEFDFLPPQDPAQGRVPVVTPEMLNLQEQSYLHPAGHYSSRITVAPSVKLPQGWQFGTALERSEARQRRGRGRIAFAGQLR